MKRLDGSTEFDEEADRNEAEGRCKSPAALGGGPTMFTPPQVVSRAPVHTDLLDDHGVPQRARLLQVPYELSHVRLEVREGGHLLTRGQGEAGRRHPPCAPGYASPSGVTSRKVEQGRPCRAACVGKGQQRCREQESVTKPQGTAPAVTSPMTAIA